MPKMKKTKKQSKRTFPNMGRVSSRSITRILMPEKHTIKSLGAAKHRSGICASNSAASNSNFFHNLFTNSALISAWIIAGSATNGAARIFWLPPYAKGWFEPMSVELDYTGTFKGRSTDWATAQFLMFPIFIFRFFFWVLLKSINAAA